MALTHVELYEALREHVGDEAARMMAEVVPLAADLATKHDIAEMRGATKHDIAELRGATKHDIAELRGATKHDIAELRGEMRGEFANVRGEMRGEFANVRGEMREGFAHLRTDIKASQVSNLRWMFGLFVPLWAGTWATMVAIVVKL